MRGDGDSHRARLPDNITLLRYGPIGILTLLEEIETYDRLASSGISRRGIRCTTISVKGWAIELGYFDVRGAVTACHDIQIYLLTR